MRDVDICNIVQSDGGHRNLLPLHSKCRCLICGKAFDCNGYVRAGRSLDERADSIEVFSYDTHTVYGSNDIPTFKPGLRCRCAGNSRSDDELFCCRVLPQVDADTYKGTA